MPKVFVLHVSMEHNGTKQTSLIFGIGLQAWVISGQDWSVHWGSASPAMPPHLRPWARSGCCKKSEDHHPMIAISSHYPISMLENETSFQTYYAKHENEWKWNIVPLCPIIPFHISQHVFCPLIRKPSPISIGGTSRTAIFSCSSTTSSKSSETSSNIGTQENYIKINIWNKKHKKKTIIPEYKNM